VTEQDATEQFGQADVSEVDDRWLLRLSGEISSEMRPRLDQVVDEVTGGGKPLEVDLGAVTFIDSSGIGFLARLAIESGAEVRVRNATGFTRELLDLSGLPKILRIDPA
jgi:anti-anti-sigma factor